MFKMVIFKRANLLNIDIGSGTFGLESIFGRFLIIRRDLILETIKVSIKNIAALRKFLL